jgi:hypothetical protein
MLSPGLKTRAGDQQAGSVSSIFTRFGGGKFQLAARKMRYLNDKKLGNIHPESRKIFSGTIPEKFQDIQNLIHVRPSFPSQESFWSDLEKVYPTSQGSRFETPTQPGELGPGSVIPRIPMFPKPGQSIESFREQARSIPRRPKRQAPPREPKLDPRSRLFTRIQEISDRDQEIVETPHDDSSAKDESPETGSQPAGDDPVQRQIDDRSHLEIIEPEEISTDSTGIPTPFIEEPPDRIAIEPPDSSEAPRPIVIPVSPETTPSPPRLKSAKPISLERLGKPAVRELPEAKPAPRVKPVPATPTLTKAKPAVQRRPETSPPPKVSRPRPAREVPTPPQDRTPQPSRTLDEVTPLAPTPAMGEETTPAPQLEPKVEIAPAPSLEPAVETTQAPPQPEMEGPILPMDMPLRKVVESHKQVAKALKSLEPESLTPATSPRSLIQPKFPLVQTQKYRPEPRPASRGKESTLSQPSSQFADFDSPSPTLLADRSRDLVSERIPSGQTSDDTLFRQEESPSPTITEPLSMSLAFPGSPGQPRTQTGPDTHLSSAPLEEQKSQLPPDEELPPQLSSELEPSQQPVVQREWEEPDEEIVSRQIVRRLGEPETESEPEEASIDLDQLAEDVLPLVKRILEIESERLSR